MTGVKSLVYMAGAQHDVNPREWPFLSDAFLQTPKDESSWTQVTKRANKIHTWSGLAARQSLVRHKLSSSQLKLWFCWQCVSRRCPLFKCIFLSVCCLTNTSVQSCRLMNTCHVFAHDCDACMSLQSEPVALKVSRWRLRHFLSPYCQMLLGCCLHWFIRSGKQCPSSAHQHTPMTQLGLKVGTEPTASIRTVTLKSFLVPPFDKWKSVILESWTAVFACDSLHFSQN